jgi:ABC-2 type transport system permease protein
MTVLPDLNSAALRTRMPIGYEIVASVPSFRGLQGGYAAFLVPGLAALTVLSMALFGIGIGTAAARASGLLKRFWLFAIDPAAWIAAQVAMTASAALLCGTMLCIVATTVFGAHVPKQPLMFGLSICCGAIALAPMGLAIAGRSTNPHATTNWMNVAYLPLMFLSGIYFPNDNLPDALRKIAAILPVQPLVRSLRLAFDGADPFQFALPWLQLGAWALFGGLLATRTLRWQT